MKIRNLVPVIIAVLLIAILVSQIALGDILKVFQNLSPLWLIFGFVLYTICYFFRALRFHILLDRKITVTDLFSIVSIHNMATSILPARTGELSYIYLIKERKGISYTEGIATLTIVRVFDFITILFLFSLSALYVESLPQNLLKLLQVISGFFVLIILLFIFSLYFKRRLARFIESLDMKRLGKLTSLSENVKETTKKLTVIKMETNLLYITLISIILWCLLYLVNYVLLLGMGIHLGIAEVIFASTFALLATLLPIQGIAGFGTTEGAWGIAFMLIGLSKEVAIVSGFGVHIILIVFFVVLGLVGTIRLKNMK